MRAIIPCFLLLKEAAFALLLSPPPPPEPEPIEVTRLPLPPVAPSSIEGACTLDVNSHGTGCILQIGGLIQSGSFLPDGRHVIAAVNFTGAPAAPDPASVFLGEQIILVKADGTTFPNGDPWKCVTCVIPKENAAGLSNAAWDYPQAFRDGLHILAGPNIIECRGADFASEECTPNKTHVYPIRWNTSPDGSGAGGSIRELRIHPDSTHLGYNSFGVDAGRLSQNGYFARLAFNPSPTAGEPRSPRYDLVNATVLFNTASEYQPLIVDGDKIRLNPSQISVGELRGFSGTGKEVSYIGYSYESSNIDVFAVDLTTGAVRRLTAHPEYCDPVDISPDDAWTAIMDTRGTDRQMFMAGMRHVPPITDLVSSTVASSTRNNGQRRFFRPYIVDQYGDRGTYFGQAINGAGDGSPGSINDPQWNGRADPKWSLDGTKIVYWEALTIPPACGGRNPLPCPNSTEPGGRTERLMLATLTSRTPVPVEAVAPAADTVPWGMPYYPGDAQPKRPYPPQGNYTLVGAASGAAAITIVENANSTAIRSVAVSYSNYSDDGLHILNGWENVTSDNPSLTLNRIEWFSDLAQTGEQGNVTKKTSEDGFRLEIDVLTNIFDANGTLSTTIGGKEYRQPANGT